MLVAACAVLSGVETPPQTQRKHTRRLNVCLVGGSAGSHVLAASLDRELFEVNLLTRRPEAFSTISCTFDDGSTVQGTLQRASAVAAEVVPQADFVLLSLPVGASVEMLSSIAPHVAEHAIVGTLYGQGGFQFWMRQLLPAQASRSFAFKYFPFVARIPPGGYGCRVHASSGRVHGGELAVACDRASAISEEPLSTLLAQICSIIGVAQPCQVPWMELLLAPNNQLVHMSRLFALHGGPAASGIAAAPFAKPPLFYQAWDEASSAMVHAMEDDMRALQAALQRAGHPPMGKIYLKRGLALGYGPGVISDASTLETIYTSNANLAGLRMPSLPSDDGCGVVADTTHRFFTDDVPWGLVVLRSLGDILQVRTPAIDSTLRWAQAKMGHSYLLSDGRLAGPNVVDSGALPRFGVGSIDGLLS